MSFPFWREVRTCVFLTAIVVVVKKKVCATIISSSSGSTRAIVDLVGLLLFRWNNNTKGNTLPQIRGEKEKENLPTVKFESESVWRQDFNMKKYDEPIRYIFFF